MKINLILFLWGCFLLNLNTSAQRRGRPDVETWKKAVINIETEDAIYPPYFIEHVCDSLRQAGYDHRKVDSIKFIYDHTTASYSGTAVYVQYYNRRYLVTALHNLLDEVLVDQKMFETRTGKVKWEPQLAIYPRISIRTPYQYYIDSGGAFNNVAAYWNNFVKGPTPYYFIIDSTGDGIGIISLQARDYRWLDDRLKRNGYEPLSLDDITPDKKDKDIRSLDTVYTIGYPETISVAARGNWSWPIPPNQSTEIVIPFTVEGQIAMYHPRIQHFYVNITAYPGNSGGPIIKNGKLIGLISGSNRNRIFDENSKSISVYGIGHLICIINTYELYEGLKKFRQEEDKLLSKENFFTGASSFSGNRQSEVAH